MANELYNNTYEKDITANILLKTGLDYSEIAMLLASQVSNCIKLVLRGQQIWIEQVTALAVDLSNKECFEASISYTYCGRTLVYKAKLNITYAPNCVAPILQTITFASGSFTITGQIANSYLEYSTNNGTTWTRLPTPYPDTTSITTSLLPTNVDLKVRMVAVCDETKISNEIYYDYIEPPINLIAGARSQALSTDVGGCDAGIQTNINCFFKLQNPLDLQNGDLICNTNNENDPFIGDITQYYKVKITDVLWAGINSSWLVQMNSSGIITIINVCA